MQATALRLIQAAVRASGECRRALLRGLGDSTVAAHLVTAIGSALTEEEEAQLETGWVGLCVRRSVSACLVAWLTESLGSPHGSLQH
jgi:hypothetical protein